MKDIDVERDKRQRWQWIAGGATLLLLVTLLAGPWIAHSYFVRTVSGCYALGGVRHRRTKVMPLLAGFITSLRTRPQTMGTALPVGD